MKSKVLVTGGLGFQGSHVARALAAEGRHVTVLNTPSPRARRIATTLDPAIRLVYGSVHDAEILEKVLPDHDAVLHLAAWASVDVSLDRPWPPFEINAHGTYALLDGVRRFCPEARVVIASSCEVYGPAEPGREFVGPDLVHPHLIPQDESAPMLPRSPYAATKVAADRFAYAFAVTYGMDLVILRPCNVFGPYQRAGASGAVIPTFTRAALEGWPLMITGGGQQLREFLWVDDVVEAYRLVLDAHTDPGATFNVGSGEIRTIEALAHAVVALTGSASALIHGVARVADVSGFLLNSGAFRGRFGWKPTVTLDAGLDRFVTWAQGDGRAWLT